MPKCRNCVHWEACREYVTGLAAARGVDLDATELEQIFDSDDCDHFHDSSRFVELPCHVGDTVYMLTEQTQKLGRKKITKTVIVECCVDNFRIGDAGYPSAALCDNENVWCYGVEPKMFGEIIFLSREAAEQALKEREP